MWVWVYVLHAAAALGRKALPGKRRRISSYEYIRPQPELAKWCVIPRDVLIALRFLTH